MSDTLPKVIETPLQFFLRQTRHHFVVLPWVHAKDNRKKTVDVATEARIQKAYQDVKDGKL